MTDTLPLGVEPASKHYLAAWCGEDDIPVRRLPKETDGGPASDIQLGWMIAAATELLYVLSGRQFRSGRSVVRPCSIQSGFSNQSYLYPYSSMSGYGSAWGFAAGWAWTAIGMGWWQNGQDLAEVLLQAPVTRINRVTVDGAVLGPDQYTLYDRRRLVRNLDMTGGTTGAWPWNQQLQLPATMPGTWEIDYEWGKSPPLAGRLACAELAVQLALSFSGSDDCRLPARVLTIASEGVSVGGGDPLSFLQQELTGIPIIDLFLQAYNPGKKRRRAVFLSPNSVQGRAR